MIACKADRQDDFTIKDNNGYPVIKCAGKTFSMRDRKGDCALSGDMSGR